MKKKLLIAVMSLASGCNQVVKCPLLSNRMNRGSEQNWKVCSRSLGTQVRKKTNKSGHTRTPVTWSYVSSRVPSEIKSEKSLRSKISLMAAYYKRLMYNEFKVRKFSGGWYVLAHENFLNNGYTKVLPPKDLGLKVISANSWSDYKNSIIKYIRAGALSLLSCEMEKEGRKVKVRIKLKNNTNSEISFETKRGQIFEQTGRGIGRVPNVVVWNYLKQDNENRSLKHKVKAEKIEVTIPENEKIEIVFDVRYLNKPMGTALEAQKLQLHITDLITPSIVKARGDQVKFWGLREEYIKEEHSQNLRVLN